MGLRLIDGDMMRDLCGFDTGCRLYFVDGEIQREIQEDDALLPGVAAAADVTIEALDATTLGGIGMAMSIRMGIGIP